MKCCLKDKVFKSVSILLCFILAFGATISAFASDEIPEGYTPIYTAEDLNNIRNNLSGSYILMNDIDLSEYNWAAIGTYEEPFTGTFDGNGKIIDNLTIHVFTEEAFTYAALFGAVSGGSIKNTTVKDCDINVEAKSGKIWGVCASGLVALGNKGASIENCIVSGNIAVKTDKEASAGGIAAGFGGKISNCKNQANISVDISYDIRANIYVGGIAGSNSVEVINSCNYGSLSVSYFPTQSSGWINIGGIVGESLDGIINNCYNVGNIFADTNQILRLGGISGYSTTITNSHNYGAFSVSEGDFAIGGISGQTEFWSQSGIGESEIIAELTNCYYVNETIPSTYHTDEKLMTNVKHLTAEEFKLQESFAGFDFENTWIMNEEQTYPVLRNEPETIEDDPEPPTAPEPEPTCWLLRIFNFVKRIWSFVVNTVKSIF